MHHYSVLAQVQKPLRTKENFRKNLLQLLAIVFPRVISKESLMLLLHTSFLVGRTFLSILVANLDGAIVKTLVGRDGKGFLYYLLVWILLGMLEEQQVEIELMN
jgi:ATP-binding cassette subfamily D (ALD) long-chain fatty acid import protein